MCLVGPGTCEPVRPTGGRKRGESASHAAARCTVYRHTVLWEPSHDGLAAWPGLCGQSEARDTADAPDGQWGDLREAKAESAQRRAQDLSVSLAGGEDRAGQPRVEHRYHVYPLTARLYLPGGGD